MTIPPIKKKAVPIAEKGNSPSKTVAMKFPASRSTIAVCLRAPTFVVSETARISWDNTAKKARIDSIERGAMTSQSFVTSWVAGMM